MAAFVKAGVEPGTRALAAHWYCGTGVFELERERIFARDWICAGRAQDAAGAGDFFVCEIAGESVIVVRGTDGVLRAFYNVCRHRGTQLCTEPAGRFAGSITCPYHAWTYGLDGALRTARTMSGAGGFDPAEFPLHAVPLELLGGFVFVSLAEEPSPFAEAFAPLHERLARIPLAELCAAQTVRYEVACNWKLVFQNYSECYHCPVLHPQLDRLSPSDSGRNDLAEGPFLGGYSELRAAAATLSETGTSSRPPLRGVGGADLGRVYYYTVFPSLLLSLHPDYVLAHIVRPLAPDRTEVACSWLFEPVTIAGAGFDPGDAVAFWDLTNRQDWRINELTQLGIASRAYVPGPYADGEGLLAAFDRHYLRTMQGA